MCGQDSIRTRHIAFSSVLCTCRCVCLFEQGWGWAAHTQSTEGKQHTRWMCTSVALIQNLTILQDCAEVWACFFCASENKVLFLWFTAFFSLTPFPLDSITGLIGDSYNTITICCPWLQCNHCTGNYAIHDILQESFQQYFIILRRRKQTKTNIQKFKNKAAINHMSLFTALSSAFGL